MPMVVFRSRKDSSICQRCQYKSQMALAEIKLGVEQSRDDPNDPGAEAFDLDARADDTHGDGVRQGLPFGRRHAGGWLHRFGQGGQPVIRSEFWGVPEIEVSPLREPGHHIDALPRHSGQKDEATIHPVTERYIARQQSLPQGFKHGHLACIAGRGDDLGDGAAGKGENRQSPHDGEAAPLFLPGRVMVLLLVGGRIGRAETGCVNDFHRPVPARYMMQRHAIRLLCGLFHPVLQKASKGSRARAWQ